MSRKIILFIYGFDLTQKFHDSLDVDLQNDIKDLIGQNNQNIFVFPLEGNNASIFLGCEIFQTWEGDNLDGTCIRRICSNRESKEKFEVIKQKMIDDSLVGVFLKEYIKDTDSDYHMIWTSAWR